MKLERKAIDEFTDAEIGDELLRRFDAGIIACVAADREEGSYLFIRQDGSRIAQAGLASTISQMAVSQMLEDTLHF